MKTSERMIRRNQLHVCMFVLMSATVALPPRFGESLEISPWLKSTQILPLARWVRKLWLICKLENTYKRMLIIWCVNCIYKEKSIMPLRILGVHKRVLSLILWSRLTETGWPGSERLDENSKLQIPNVLGLVFQRGKWWFHYHNLFSWHGKTIISIILWLRWLRVPENKQGIDFGCLQNYAGWVRYLTSLWFNSFY